MSSAPKVPGAAIYTRQEDALQQLAQAELRQHVQNLLWSLLFQVGVAHSGILLRTRILFEESCGGPGAGLRTMIES